MLIIHGVELNDLESISCSTEWNILEFTKCSLRYATHRTKSALSSYTDELSTSRVQANHSLGLQAAFSLIPSGQLLLLCAGDSKVLLRVHLI